jgi:hypothetical protein
VALEPRDVFTRSVRHTRFAVHRPRELTHAAQVYRAYLRRNGPLRSSTRQ